MSTGLWVVILAAIGVAGFTLDRWWLIPVLVVLWMAVLGLAGLLGAYHATAEDSSGALVFFAAWGTLPWVVALQQGPPSGSYGGGCDGLALAGPDRGA